MSYQATVFLVKKTSRELTSCKISHICRWDFKYQTTLKVLLSKLKEIRDGELTAVYFNSTAKTASLLILIIMVLINLFNRLYTDYIIRLMKDLFGQLNT